MPSDRPVRGLRLYLDTPLREGLRLELPAEAAHHAGRVLRLREGEELRLFDGRGGEYPATIEAIVRARVTVSVGAQRDIERESPLGITLVQGISSGERMDLTIQKAVELGVKALQPVLSEKSIVRLDAERAQVKCAHWQRVAIAACEQCGRNRIPEVLPVRTLGEWCRTGGGAALRLLLSPRTQTRLREALVLPAPEIVLAIGPEAGFSADEEAMLHAAGYVAVRLGPRVLRTETAAPAVLAALNALAGDF
ncbi:MAG: 16S rRNA (uracil(1498)-N(3))-methyltransferase [Betaproteobacteria bacterium]|nr:16S rRNA (uracil(1498)-N(3))-methyltransferase [Betaproteobacteria bacterium]